MAEYNDNNDQKDTRPLGDRVRDFLESPLNDKDRKQIQLNILEDFFYDAAEEVPKHLEKKFLGIFNKVAKIENEEDRNFVIIEEITRLDPRTGAPGYSATAAMGIPVSMEFTEFSWNDIRELPGYIKLHEAARDCNIAIDVTGLVEKGADGMAMPARITLHTNKTYDQGAMAYSQSYPHLPEKQKPVVNKKPSTGSFKF